MASNGSISWSKVQHELLSDTSLTEDDRRLLQQNSLDDLGGELEENEETYEKKSIAVYLKNHLGPFVAVFSAFDGVITTLASLDPHGIAGMVVGSVKIMVKWGQGYSEAFEKISGHLNKIGQSLGRLLEYETLFTSRQSKRLEIALLRVFKAYWTFFRDAHRLLSRYRSERKRDTAKRIYHGFTDYVTGHLDKIALQGDDVQSCCAEAVAEVKLVSAQKQADDAEKVFQRFDDIESNQNAELFTNFMRWLNPVEFDTRLDGLLQERAPETGTWIFSDDLFSRWLFPVESGSSQQDPSILWMTASSGFGKSSISAFIIDQLKSRFPTGVSYFFCDKNENDKQNVRAMLETLLHELLRTDNDIGESHLKVQPSTLKLGHGFHEPSVKFLCKTIGELAREQESNKKTYFILDGLDECPQSKTSQAEFRQLFELFQSLPRHKWRILLVSRPFPWMEEDLRRILRLRLAHREITQEQIRQDIIVYINYKLEALSHDPDFEWDANLMRTAVSRLTKSISGGFQTKTLLLGRLAKLKNDPEAADQLLHHPFDDTDTIYGLAYQNFAHSCDPEERDEMARALRWILRSFRPLTVSELEASLSSDPLKTKELRLREKLEKNLDTFLKVSPERGEIRLVHTSARDFLMNVDRSIYSANDSFRLMPARPVDVDLDIFSVCLWYLGDSTRPYLNLETIRNEGDTIIHHQLTEMYPFWEYASIGWIYHLNEVCSEGALASKAIPHLIQFMYSENDQFVLKWLQLFAFLYAKRFNGATLSYSYLLNAFVDNPPPNAESLHGFVTEHCNGLQKHLAFSDGGRFLRWQRFMESTTPPFYPPTVLAAFFNYTSTLNHLLASGESTEYPDYPTKPNTVFWAASGDSCDALSLLLGSKYRDKFPGFRDPLSKRDDNNPLAESIWLPYDIVRRPGKFPCAVMLLENDAKVSRPLEEMVLDNVEDCEESGGLVSRILQIEDTFTFTDQAVGNVLNYASFVGQSHILAVLLDTDSIQLVEVRLFWKMMWTFVKLLFYDKVLFRSVDYSVIFSFIFELFLFQGLSPFHHAARNNSARTATLLFERPRHDIVCVFNDWWSLHFAAQQSLQTAKWTRERSATAWWSIKRPIPWSEHVIHTLLAQSADPSVADSAGNLPLHLAVSLGHTECVKLLAQQDHEWDIPNSSGKTPLTLAIEVGNIESMRYLLSRGADPEKVPDNLNMLQHMLYFDSMPSSDVHAFPQSKASESANTTPSGRFVDAKRHIYQPCLSIKWVSTLRALSGSYREAGHQIPYNQIPFLPIPIIARILDHISVFSESNAFEQMTTERRDYYQYSQMISETPYMKSATIMGFASAPVRSLTLTAHSKRQTGADDPREKTWSWLRSDRVENETDRILSWHPEPIWRWNYEEATTESKTYSATDPQDRRALQSFKPGDRVAILPITPYPAWFAKIEWASIDMKVSILRDRWTIKDRQKLWPDVARGPGLPELDGIHERYRSGEQILDCEGLRDMPKGSTELFRIAESNRRDLS
ncbi:MAG: hypothetical protein M1821_002251 [Bathelium mastoideum]|nr:MAG: hypothetical protein M1821_002251 [Bathelium mastoideum]